MSAADGGSAFPVLERFFDRNDGHYYGMSGGMTLRDYFAAKAMGGMCANNLTADTTNAEIAKIAYIVADAMLKARAE